MRTIIPTLDRILIKEVEVVSAGMIVIADMGKKKQQLHGIVVALGTGRIMSDGQHCPIESVKVGDKVIFGNLLSNVTDYIDGDTFILVQEHGIVGVIEGDADSSDGDKPTLSELLSTIPLPYEGALPKVIQVKEDK